MCIYVSACVHLWGKKVETLTLIWPNRWPTYPPSSDGSWSPPLPRLSVWSGASSPDLTPRQTSRALCAPHWELYLYRGSKMSKTERERWHDWFWTYTECFLFPLIFKCAHACRKDGIIDDFSWDWLRTDESHRPPLVQQSVHVFGSLQHGLHGVTGWCVGHMGKVLLFIVSHPITILWRDNTENQEQWLSDWEVSGRRAQSSCSS